MRISACQMISGIDPEQNGLDAVNLISEIGRAHV